MMNDGMMNDVKPPQWLMGECVHILRNINALKNIHLVDIWIAYLTILSMLYEKTHV